MESKMWVWLFLPTCEVVLSNKKNWPKGDMILLAPGAMFDGALFHWMGPRYISKHQFAFLGEL